MYQKFPIWRDAEDLVLAIEQAVRTAPRYHKYTLGTEMRQTAYRLLTAIGQAIQNVAARIDLLAQAHALSEVLKIKIQLAKKLNLYASFKQFEVIAALAYAVSKQCKGWQKRLQRPHQQEHGRA